MTLLILATAGSLGSLCRYLLSGWAQGRNRSAMPVGTATVNLLGAFAFGLIAGATDLGSTSSIALVGFTGGFTTFSTWMVETVGLGVVPRLGMRAAINLAGTLIVGIALAAAGFHLAS